VEAFVFENQLVIMVAASLVGIVFIGLALGEWSRQGGRETSSWRRALGVASIILISLGYTALYVPPLFGSRDPAWVSIPMFAIPISIGLCFALRGPTRSFVLLANVFMIVTLYAAVTI